MRCSGSSFACATSGCERAGEVNQVWMGAVMGRSVLWKLCEAVAADSVASARAEVGVLLELGMGGYTTTAVTAVTAVSRRAWSGGSW
jgi:hypothetical protein